MNQANVAPTNATLIDRPDASEKRRPFVVLLLVISLFVILGTCQRWVSTNRGTGSGEAATGSIPALIVVQTGALVPLIPGDSAQTLRGTFTNTGRAPVHVTSVTASLTGVTGNRGPCTTADYLLLDPVMPVDRVVEVGEGVDGWSGATIQMVHDPETIQDGCKLATLDITYVIR